MVINCGCVWRYYGGGGQGDHLTQPGHMATLKSSPNQKPRSSSSSLFFPSAAVAGERLPRVLHHGPVPAHERVADPQRPGQRDHNYSEPGDLEDVHHPGPSLHLCRGRTLLGPRPCQSHARRSVRVCVCACET